MAGLVDVLWPTCEEEGCIAVRLEPGKCLAHAGDDDRKAALEQVAQTRNIDARGVTISLDLVDQLLAAIRSGPNADFVLKHARFDEATFTGDAEFGTAVFTGDASFDGATFTGHAGFLMAVFTGVASFDGATFKDYARFERATFKGDAGFGGATFEADAGFGGATFEADAWFGGANFTGDAGFAGANFTGDAGFDRATFTRVAGFGEATFTRVAGFGEATFTDNARFDEATFKDDARFLRTTFTGVAGFERTTFTRDTGFGEATFTGDARFDRVTFKGVAGFERATFKGVARFLEATFTGDARFGEATFTGGAGFSDATFTGDARFDRVTFKGDAGFSEATFTGRAWFGAATFTGRAWFDGATFTGDAWFDGATFTGPAGFDGATFEADAWFDGATITGRAEFIGAPFKGRAGFGGSTFTGDAWFVEATFTDDAEFGGATFRRVAAFDRATFRRDARFGEATFKDNATFHEATFKDNARFHAATFTGDARFLRTTFTGDAWFDGATFRGGAWFDEAVFERARRVGSLLCHRGLSFDDARFGQPVVIEASTTGLCCRRAQFPGGVQFRLRWARIVLDDTDLSAPSLLTGIPRLADDGLAAREDRSARAWIRLHGGRISEQPRILSLRRANVAALGLSNVNLTDCRFAGAHNLDLMRLDGDITLGLSPAWAGWERRRVIAEETQWRASVGRPSRWSAPQWPGWAGDKPEPADPGTVAGVYRALRKGREDAKDEPGAADFYYGEMEMRRHTAGPASERETGSRGQVDRGVLTAYWLASGYGLRAWRAFAWFAVVAAVFGALFYPYGFVRPPRPDTYWTSLLYAFRSTLSLSGDAVTLSAWGDLLQALLRITGPVLLGLGLLALRGRVKR